MGGGEKRRRGMAGDAREMKGRRRVVVQGRAGQLRTEEERRGRERREEVREGERSEERRGREGRDPTLAIDWLAVVSPCFASTHQATAFHRLHSIDSSPPILALVSRLCLLL